MNPGEIRYYWMSDHAVSLDGQISCMFKMVKQ